MIDERKKALLKLLNSIKPVGKQSVDRPEITNQTGGNQIMIAAPFFGEFGWELMKWHGFLRAASRHALKSIVYCKPGMEFLYSDFAKVIAEPLFSKVKYPDMFSVSKADEAKADEMKNVMLLN